MIFAILSRRVKEDIAYKDFRRADPADLRRTGPFPPREREREQKEKVKRTGCTTIPGNAIVALAYYAE
ncbi:MAG: hypothetical protein WBL42_09340 [Methanoregula sp.]